MDVNKRIRQFVKFKGMPVKDFEAAIGRTNGYLSHTKSPTANVIKDIVEKYPELNLYWLLTGKGEMLKANPDGMDINRGVPYWNLPVSAGRSLMDIIGANAPTGYITGLPGADIAENIFPVTGTSMEPEILNGAIVGVRKMNNWESLNTERIYLIITRDDRMIKRIEYDPENDNILWCISPNFPKFKIFKTDIIDIERVCFVYNPK